MIYLGIDPGLTGAIAVNDHGAGSVFDIPVRERGGFVKTEVDAVALARLLAGIRVAAERVDAEGCRALLESTTARPGQGVGSMFSMGDTRGTIRGALAGVGIPCTEVLPTIWKAELRLLGLDKDASLALARELFPSLNLGLVRKKDHNRAEALLLAHYARMNRT